MSTTHLFNTLNNSAIRYRNTSPHSIMTNTILHVSSPATLSNNSFPITKTKANAMMTFTAQQSAKITKPSKTKKTNYLEGFDTVSFTANQSMFGVTRKRKSKPIEYEQVLNFGCIAPPASENSVIPRKMRQSMNDNYSNVSSNSSVSSQTTRSNIVASTSNSSSERTSPRIVRTSISIRELLN